MADDHEIQESFPYEDMSLDEGSCEEGEDFMQQGRWDMHGSSYTMQLVAHCNSLDFAKKFARLSCCRGRQQFEVGEDVMPLESAQEVRPSWLR